MHDEVKLDKQGNVIYLKEVDDGTISESWFKYKAGEQVLVKFFEESIPTDYIEHI
ncbi:hypothetical protein N9Z65_00865 [bacterium]|nr:hypothetical protein [bacterium]